MKNQRSKLLRVVCLVLTTGSIFFALHAGAMWNASARGDGSSTDGADELPPGKPTFTKPKAPQSPKSSDAPASDSASASPSTPTTTQPGHDYSTWEKYERLIAKNYYVFEDDYVSNIKYNSDYPSSKGVTVRDVMQENSKTTLTENAMGVKTLVQTDMLKEEAEAVALPLQNIAQGEYGYILSANIKEILGPNEMWIDQIWLINSTELTRVKDQLRNEAIAQDARERELEKQRNANNIYNNTYNNNSTSSTAGTSSVAILAKIAKDYAQRDRLAVIQRSSEFQRGFIVRGIPTQGLAAKTRWGGDSKTEHGVQLVIVDSQNQGNARKKEQVYVAVPGSIFLHHLDEAQFKEMLAKRNITPDQFIDLVETERKKDLKTFEINVIRKLDALKEPKPTDQADPKKSQPGSSPRKNTKPAAN